jgi:SAM-dependent methyltransferase
VPHSRTTALLAAQSPDWSRPLTVPRISRGSRLLLRVGDIGLARSHQLELLDGAGWNEEELRGNFRDIERVNRWMGGSALTIRGVAELVARTDPTRQLTILDLGTGSGDIPKTVCDWARRWNRKISIVATDRSPEILQLASTGGYPEIRFEPADACNLEYPASSFDIVTSSLLLHHLPADRARAALIDMGRVARLGVMINDIVRHNPGYWIARLLSILTTTNRLTRADGPLSVRRALTLVELFNLFEGTNLDIARVDQWGLYRVGITALVDDSANGVDDDHV